MRGQPASLLRTLINILELRGRDDEMYLLCHFGKKNLLLLLLLLLL